MFLFDQQPFFFISPVMKTHDPQTGAAMQPDPGSKQHTMCIALQNPTLLVRSITAPPKTRSKGFAIGLPA